jgi:hypothetical protein
MLELHGDKATLAEYQEWRHKLLRRPLSERQRHAVMQPIVAALDSTLSEQWNWRNIMHSQQC